MAEYIGQNLYIKPNYIVSVPEFDSPKNLYSNARVKNEVNLIDKKHKGSLSPKAKKRICAAINWLVVSAKSKVVYQKRSNKRFNFKINLITLTLPDTSEPITEHQFKTKLIHPWLVYMKKYHGLKNYVWKVEYQQNGKLHLHITSDTYIDSYIIRHRWNSLLKSNGFLNDFIAKFKHDNPNSTDVHAVWKVENLSAYLAKYLSKNEQSSDQLNGRIWGCNYELSDKRKCHVFVDRYAAHSELRCLMSPNIKWKDVMGINKKTGLPIRMAEIFFTSQLNWKNDINGIVKEAYDRHRFQIRNHVELPEIKTLPIPVPEPVIPVSIPKPIQAKLTEILYESHVHHQTSRGYLIRAYSYK